VYVAVLVGGEENNGQVVQDAEESCRRIAYTC